MVQDSGDADRVPVRMVLDAVSLDRLVAVLRRHLNHHANLSAALQSGRRQRIELLHINMDRSLMESGYLNNDVHAWVNSEEARWAMHNIAKFDVHSCLSPSNLSVTLSVTAVVPETVSVEHALRWR